MAASANASASASSGSESAPARSRYRSRTPRRMPPIRSGNAKTALDPGVERAGREARASARAGQGQFGLQHRAPVAGGVHAGPLAQGELQLLQLGRNRR